MQKAYWELSVERGSIPTTYLINLKLVGKPPFLFGTVYYNLAYKKWEAREYQSTGDIITQHQTGDEAEAELVKRCAVLLTNSKGEVVSNSPKKKNRNPKMSRVAKGR